MKIELKNTKVAKHLSAETIAFTANVYINDTKAANCKNDGQGGPTIYWPYAVEHRILITQAEDYCKTLPPIETAFQDPNDRTKKFCINMNLENFIDQLLDAYIGDKEKQQFERRKEKDMQKAILVGTDTSYRTFNPSRALDEIIKHNTDPVGAINNIIKQILPKMKPGERILNTNFPEGVIIAENNRVTV